MPTLVSLPPDSFGLVCDQLQTEIEWQGNFAHFWKELSGIEEENAKKILKLCRSSDANLKQSGLQKVLSKSGKNFYDSTMHAAWFHTKEQVEKLANRRLELADTLRCSVSVPLQQLSKDCEKKLNAIAMEGKHAIAMTRQAFLNLHKAQAEYYELRKQSIRHSNEFHDTVARHMNENQFNPPTPAAKQTANQKSNEVRARRLDQHRLMTKTAARASMQRYHQSVEVAKNLRQNLLTKNLPDSYQKLEEIHIQVSNKFADAWQTLAGLIAVLPRYCEDIHREILVKRDAVRDSIEADVAALAEAAQKGARKEQSVPDVPNYQPFDGKETLFYKNTEEQSEENAHEQNMFAEHLGAPGLRSITPPLVPAAAATAPVGAGGAASPVVWSAAGADRPTPSAPPMYPPVAPQPVHFTAPAAFAAAPEPAQPSTLPAQPSAAAASAAGASAPPPNLTGPPAPFAWEEPVKPLPQPPQPSPNPPPAQEAFTAPQFPPTVVAARTSTSATTNADIERAEAVAPTEYPPVVAVPITRVPSPIPEIPDVVKPAPAQQPQQQEPSPTASEATQPSLNVSQEGGASLNVSQEGGEVVVPTPAVPAPLEAPAKENGAANGHSRGGAEDGSPSGSPGAASSSPRGEDIVASFNQPNSPLTQSLSMNTSRLSEEEWRDVRQNADGSADGMKLLEMLNALQVMAKDADYYALYGLGMDGSVFVHRNVTLQQVTRQRRQLSAALHPDRQAEDGKEDAAAQLAKINQVFAQIFKTPTAWGEYNRLCDLRSEYAHWMHEDNPVRYARVRDLKSLRRNIKKNSMPLELTAEVQNAYKFLATILATTGNE